MPKVRQPHFCWGICRPVLQSNWSFASLKRCKKPNGLFTCFRADASLGSVLSKIITSLSMLSPQSLLQLFHSSESRPSISSPKILVRNRNTVRNTTEILGWGKAYLLHHLHRHPTWEKKREETRHETITFLHLSFYYHFYIFLSVRFILNTPIFHLQFCILLVFFPQWLPILEFNTNFMLCG